MKYKVGDEIIIINNKWTNEVPIGTITTVVKTPLECLGNYTATDTGFLDSNKLEWISTSLGFNYPIDYVKKATKLHKVLK